MAEIKIYGTLVNATTDPKIAKASQIFDEGLNKYQSEINASFGATDNSIRKELTDFKNTKGKANGLASLDNGGKVPSSQLPSYVDDVIEINTFNNLPSTGESGKIYITQDTNLTYRWSGSAYTEISKSLALGETSSTAYPGDKGKSTTDIVNSLSDTLVNDVLVSQSNQDSVSLTVKSITKNSTNKSNKLLLTDGEPVLLTDGSPILLAENDGLYSQADDKTITINQASAFAAGVMSSSDKTKLDGLKSQAEIDTTINNVQNNLTTHINNKANPHQVTKEQVGLGNVNNTSDANKPISTATQNALNDKFSATEGNTLKQIVNDMPDLVVTGGRLRHNSDSVSFSLIQQNPKNPDDTDSLLLKFKSVTDSTAGIILPSDKSKIDKIITNGDGTKYLADNGQYKTVQGGSADIEAIKKYVDDKLDKEMTDRTEGDNSIWEVLYDQFVQISGFGVSPTIIEKGVATDINISGRFLFAGNPLTPDTLTLKMNDHVISNRPVNNLSGTKDTLTITSDRITYSVSITAHGVTKNASATVSTYYPCYFGHTTKTIIVGTDVLSFSKQSIKSSPNGTYSMSGISQGEYVWLCIPSNFNINSVTSSGFSVPMEAAISVPVEGKGNYKCYRTSSSLVAGTFNFVIG